MERRVLGIIKARSFLARLEEWFLNSSGEEVKITVELASAVIILNTFFFFVL